MADFKDSINNINNTPDTTGEFDQQDIAQNKVMAILAYIGILVLVPIFAAKESKFARFHANQGLVLAITEIILSIVISILAFIPIIGLLIGIVGYIAELGCLVLAILGIVNAANGKAKELPIIGKFRVLK